MLNLAPFVILPIPVTSNVTAGVAVPMPNLLFILSKKKFALSWAIVVPFENKTDPEVSAGKAKLLIHWVL